MSASRETEAAGGAAVRIFQSYGWRDAQDVAERLKSSLVEAGYEVWIDREHMRADEQHFSLVLEQALEQSRIVIALLSPHSVRGLKDEDRRSSICYNEVRVADQLERPIVPVRVQQFAGLPPFLLVKYRLIDWRDWQEPGAYQRGVAEILRTIGQVLQGEKNLDRDIAYQITNFSAQLRTAQESFSGREWLFERLRQWLAGPSRGFLIKGAAGSGKTAFVAELVRRNPEGRIAACHFCSATAGTLDPIGFVRGIAYMLATSIDGYAEKMLRGNLGAELRANDPFRMLSQGVLAPLGELAVDGRQYCIVIDALDEAMQAREAGVTLPELLMQAEEQFPPWLRLLITTRPNDDIEGMFGAGEACGLGQELLHQRQDLRAYIERRLGGGKLQATVPVAERAGQARAIAERAEGSFQYAAMAVDALERGEMALAQVGELEKGLAQLYFRRAMGRFPPSADFAPARSVLGLILAAREPLSEGTLARLSGLDAARILRPTLEALNCFVDVVSGTGTSRAFRITHSSIGEWFLSEQARKFRVDPAPSSAQLCQLCRDWKANHEPYAMKHLIGHLLAAGETGEALQAVADGLFRERLEQLKEPRLDADDSRSLTLSLLARQDRVGIETLARTTNSWQRDGVAAALLSAPADQAGFVDQVVGALLALAR